MLWRYPWRLQIAYRPNDRVRRVSSVSVIRLDFCLVVIRLESRLMAVRLGFLSLVVAHVTSCVVVIRLNSRLMNRWIHTASVV